MKKLVVIGSSNVDTVIRVPHIPAPGETLLSKSLDLCYGGKGANQAAAIARLGGDITMIACVGEDAFGQSMCANLAGYGVKMDGVVQMAGAQSGAAYIYVSDEGENNIVVHPGANSLLSPEVVARQAHLLEGASYCIIQLEIPLDTLYFVAQLCREKGIRLILNPAPAAPLDYACLQDTWMIAPNEGELDLLIPGEGDVATKAKALRQKGFEHVLVTLGAQGCLLVDGLGVQRFPAGPVAKVVDTTAAGDSFIGALAFGLSSGFSLECSIGFANRSAAITVSRAGAQPSLPTLAEVQAALASKNPLH